MSFHSKIIPLKKIKNLKLVAIHGSGTRYCPVFINGSPKFSAAISLHPGLLLILREYGVLMLGDNPETGEDVALKLVQEGLAKV
jgi:hypothetical protein